MRNPFKKIEKRSAQSITDFMAGNDLDYSTSSITPTTSLKLSAVQACVRVLSEDIASLPLDVYKNTPDGKEKAKDHPLYDILHQNPSKYMDSFTFFQTAMSQLLLWGNC
jgi:HK97 family phage portal protein